MTKKTIALTLATGLSLMTSGCMVYVGGGSDSAHVSGVFGNINIDPNSLQGNLSMVNGNVTVGHHSQVKNISTVNGDITVAEHVSMKHAETVNGNIHGESHIQSSGNVTTVNGNIVFQSDSQVQGEVTTVNGTITLNGTLVDSDVVSTNGDIQLKQKTLIKGNVYYRESDSWGASWFSDTSNLPKLEIDEDSVIEGDIILERPVELLYQPASLKGQVIERFSKK